MICSVKTLGISGIQGSEISAECFISNGLPGFDIVGLPDAAVKEARDRVRAAAKSSGMTFPVSRITVNLAPASLRKAGTHYDLPILLSILAASGVVRRPKSTTAFLGEVGLDGTVRSVSGVLPMALEAKRAGIQALFVPAENAAEATLANGPAIYPVRTVRELADALNGEIQLQHHVAAVSQVKGIAQASRSIRTIGGLAVGAHAVFTVEDFHIIIAVLALAIAEAVVHAGEGIAAAHAAGALQAILGDEDHVHLAVFLGLVVGIGGGIISLGHGGNVAVGIVGVSIASACPVGADGDGSDLPGGGVCIGIAISVLCGQDRPSLPGQYLFRYPSVAVIFKGQVTTLVCDDANATAHRYYSTPKIFCTCRNWKIFVNSCKFPHFHDPKFRVTAKSPTVSHPPGRGACCRARRIFNLNDCRW